MEVDRHVHRQGDLHRTVQEEEDPGHECQAQQIRTSQEPESRFCRARIDRLRDRRPRRPSAPGDDAEEGERPGIDGEQKAGADPAEEHPRQERANDGGE